MIPIEALLTAAGIPSLDVYSYNALEPAFQYCLNVNINGSGVTAQSFLVRRTLTRFCMCVCVAAQTHFLIAFFKQT